MTDNLFTRIADLLEVEPFQLIVVTLAVVAILGICLLVWFLHWTWMFQFFGE